jgi:hypothetical protein
MDYIEKDEQQHQDEDGNGFWNFKHIASHDGPFRASDPEYKGSRYNILIEWENGEITSEQSARIFGMPTSPNPFTKHMNSDLILTLLLTLCKHICVTSWG